MNKNNIKWELTSNDLLALQIIDTYNLEGISTKELFKKYMLTQADQANKRIRRMRNLKLIEFDYTQCIFSSRGKFKLVYKTTNLGEELKRVLTLMDNKYSTIASTP